MIASYTDPKVPIMVKLNQCFTISLESNPTTGYMWNPKYDSSVIEQVQPRKFDSQSSLIGGGGVESFEFCARRSGDTVIEMKYKRVWEETPIRIEKFTVNIQTD